MLSDHFQLQQEFSLIFWQLPAMPPLHLKKMRKKFPNSVDSSGLNLVATFRKYLRILGQAALCKHSGYHCCLLRDEKRLY